MGEVRSEATLADNSVSLTVFSNERAAATYVCGLASDWEATRSNRIINDRAAWSASQLSLYASHPLLGDLSGDLLGALDDR